MNARERAAELRRLKRERPRERFLALSLCALLALIAVSWASGGHSPGDLLEPRRVANARRFAAELVPHPLQGRELDAGVALGWLAQHWRTRGAEAARTTLAISIVAAALAGAAGLAGALLSARNLIAASPLLASPREPSRTRRAVWATLAGTVRAGLALLRAIPEYFWAFFLLAGLGPSAWPAVLALAVHNAGILGKLGAELIENVEPAPSAALRALGAGRAQLALAALLPTLLPRFLAFFFYRWETCVREATVLGMLGIASLGFWVVDARARTHYDEMLFFVALGGALVLLGDLASALARAALRRAA